MAQRFVNPQTGETIEWNGSEYVPVKQEAMPNLGSLEGMARLVSGQTQMTPEEQASVAALPSYGDVLKRPHEHGAGPFLQGATLGFSDELAGLGGMLQGVPYEQGRQQAMAGINQTRQEAPIKSMAGELAGGLLSFGGAAKSLAPKTGGLVPRFLRYGATGAGTGGIAGAGYSEPGNRIQGGATGATLGAVTGAAIPAVGTMAGAAARKVAEKVRGPATVAQRKLAEAMQRDSITAKEVAENLKKLGPNATITDAGGTNVLDLGKAAAMIPGKAKDKAKLLLEARQENQSARLLDMFKRTLSPEDFRAQQQAIIDSAKQKAGPLYREAYQQSVTVSDKMRNLFERPAMKAALSKARKLAKDDGVDLPDDNANIQVLDYAKRALDDRIRTAGRSTNQGRILTNLKNQLLDEIDDQVPAYKQARAQFAGEISARDAMDSGYEFITGRQEAKWGQLLDSFKGMSDVEKESFRLGAAQALRDKVMNTKLSADATRNIFNTPAMRDKLDLIFESKSARQEFVDTVLSEGTFTETRNRVLSGSRTSANTADIADLRAPVGVGEDLVQGNWVRAIAGVLRDKLGDMNKIPEPVRNELADLLFTADPAKNQAFLISLSDRVAKGQISQEQARRIGAAVAAVSGEGTGAFLAR